MTQQNKNTRAWVTNLDLFSEAEASDEQAKEAEAARLAIEGPGEGDLGEQLAGVVDIVVMDAPRTLYEPRRKLPWGPAPTTGLTVAGSGEKRCRSSDMALACSWGVRAQKPAVEKPHAFEAR